MIDLVATDLGPLDHHNPVEAGNVGVCGGEWREGGLRCVGRGRSAHDWGFSVEDCQGVEIPNLGEKLAKDRDKDHHQEWIPRLHLTQHRKHTGPRHHEYLQLWMDLS